MSLPTQEEISANKTRTFVNKHDINILIRMLIHLKG